MDPQADPRAERAAEIANELFDRAERDEQAVHVLAGDDDVALIRRLVRDRARERGVRIRTGLVGEDVLAVIRLDARLWGESTAVMRSKLRPEA